MKRMIIASLVAVAVIIIALGMYLAPNDLSSCTTHPIGTSPCQPADAIVAVSGGDTIARTKEAIKLYQNGWAPVLIFSGAAQDKSGPSNAEAMRREARTEGVPDSAILIEQESTTTKQNAENTQNIFTQNNITSVILVTSGYHQRRAGLEFKQSTNVSVRNHPVASDDQWSNTWWLTPIGWFLAISEVTKILVFYIGGSR